MRLSLHFCEFILPKEYYYYVLLGFDLLVDDKEGPLYIVERLRVSRRKEPSH